MAKIVQPIDQTAIRGTDVDQLLNTKFDQIINAINDYRHHTGSDPDPHPDVYLRAEEVLEMIQTAELFLGFYNQVADTVNAGSALPTPVGEINGKYYTLTDDGNFTSTQPGVPTGTFGTSNDHLVVYQDVYVHILQPTDYISSVIDDRADGDITFSVGAKSPIAAPSDSHFIRKGESVADDATTLADANQHANTEDDNHSADDRGYTDTVDAANSVRDQAYTDTELQAHTLEAVDTFVYAAYGGISTRDPVVGGPASIGLAWTPVTFSMQQQPATSLGVTVNAGNGTLQPSYAGVFAVAITVAFDHNSSNQGRTTRVRLYNETLGAGGAGIVIGTGRNAEATSASFTVLLEAPNDGDVFRLEIGNGDTYSAITWDAAAFQLWNVGRFTGSFGGRGFDEGFDEGFS